MIRTVEDELFDAVDQFDYYKGFGQYTDAQCIYMQILAQVLYWRVDYDIIVHMNNEQEPDYYNRCVDCSAVQDLDCKKWQRYNQEACDNFVNNMN